MKKVLSLLVALVMLLSVACFAEGTDMTVDTVTARENLTWEFQKDEY